MKGFDSQSGGIRLSGAAGLSHAYIAGSDAVDELSAAVVCSGGADGGNIPCRRCKDCDKASRHIHPDIISVSKAGDKHEFTVDLIRGIRKDIYIAPNEAAKKVYIIRNADAMNQSAQNAFLQMLEEPPKHVAFILETANPSVLLPTVRSRCVELRTMSEQAFHSEDLSEISQLADNFASALDDNMQLVKCMFDLGKLDNFAFSDFIALTRSQLAGVLRKSPGYKKAVLADDLLTKAAGMLDVYVSTGHIAGMLCASLMEE